MARREVSTYLTTYLTRLLGDARDRNTALRWRLLPSAFTADLDAVDHVYTGTSEDKPVLVAIKHATSARQQHRDSRNRSRLEQAREAFAAHECVRSAA